MMTIRKEQKQAFVERELKDFEDRMVEHLVSVFPDSCEALGDPAVRRLIREGIARAARYGIESERGVCIYIDAMFAYGRGFDADPNLPWAARILTDPSIDGPLLRADELLNATVEHLEEAQGIRADEAI